MTAGEGESKIVKLKGIGIFKWVDHASVFFFVVVIRLALLRCQIVIISIRRFTGEASLPSDGVVRPLDFLDGGCVVLAGAHIIFVSTRVDVGEGWTQQ